MSSLLDGRTAVVTGAASGIGRAIATQFAEEGADVVVADVRTEPRAGGCPTHKVVSEETESRAVHCECDVSEIDDVRRAVEAADQFGGIDTMVNNAGVTGPMGPFHEATVEEYREAMSVLLDGAFYGSKVAASKMLADDTEGAIVNISSAAGIEGYEAVAPYSAAKGGVRLLTYAMAADLGPQIRVNAIHPGVVDTVMTREDSGFIGTEVEDRVLATTPMDRVGRPEDIADAVVFLASDRAAYVSGESLLVDGGMTNTS